MNIYESIGVSTVINARGFFTSLGGSKLPKRVSLAMVEAGDNFVDLFELFRKVESRIANLTDNEDACICNGASAGMVIAIQAAINSWKEAHCETKDKLISKAPEVIILKCHRMATDAPLNLLKIEFKDVGSIKSSSIQELESSITFYTAAILYVTRETTKEIAVPLSEVVKLGKRHNIPVVVDAAARVPPRSNFSRYTKVEGADVAIFSGGKALCGPQTSGIILGNTKYIDKCRNLAFPVFGDFRAMKVSKECTVGLLEAFEIFYEKDECHERKRILDILNLWDEAFSGQYGFQIKRHPMDIDEYWEWRLSIKIEPSICGFTALELVQELWKGSPRVAVYQVNESVIQLTPFTISEGEEHVIITSLLKVAKKLIS